MQSERVVGWKAIGAFLGVDARTAKRWENARGLPVRRLPGEGSATVWASRDELRAWLAAPGSTAVPVEPPPPAAPVGASTTVPPPARFRRWGAAAAVAAVVAITAVRLSPVPPAARAPPPAAPVAAYADDAAAEQQWLAARFALATRSPDGIAAATRDFEALTRRFPDRAPAYAALAEAHLMSREFGTVPDPVAFPAAGHAARAALALDPGLADAWLDRAFVDFWWARDHAGGLAAFRQAVAREPGSAKAHHWYATAAIATGDAATATREIVRAQALEPDNHAIVADAAFIALCAGHVATAQAALRRFVVLDPGLTAGHRYLAMTDLVAGDDRGYLDEQATALRLRGQTAGLAGLATARRALASGGRAAMLAQLTADAEAAFAGGTGTAATVARFRALAGDRAGLLHWLAISRARDESATTYIVNDPELRAWRGDPAVQAFNRTR